ncbi:uncharacterized protein MYCFIDRAFT_201562 [Pseudocercospora fijiensis CIRAD86]|uniref:Uncharacterized protein n=1 Tax=Pseudocercospora fijiensis (strain CIRAD86) TaxID=383855 RepID=N1QBE3_PSEFD|nr:uncharacterized protein MYCFIDRAFT_201562 [Pseudocercospora fijiensis CIRAD86]EME88477.1 hypothetical protein MYCFIDRAFT_201562 [Pseudocercospora fijiensis CIRAD86]
MGEVKVWWEPKVRFTPVDVCMDQVQTQVCSTSRKTPLRLHKFCARMLKHFSLRCVRAMGGPLTTTITEPLERLPQEIYAIHNLWRSLLHPRSCRERLSCRPALLLRINKETQA